MATTTEQILNGTGITGNGTSTNNGTNTGATGSNDGGGDRSVVGINNNGGITPPPQNNGDPSEAARRQLEQKRAQYEAWQAKNNGIQSVIQAKKNDTTPVTPVANEPNTSPDVTPKRHLTYQEIQEKYFPEKPLTPEEIKAEQNKRRRQAVFSALGDGISALANLYYTNQYAPNAYNPEQSLSKKNYERWQKLISERKENAMQYYNAQMKALQAEDLQAIRQQNADANEAYKKSQAKKNDDIANAQKEVAKARAAKDAAATAIAEKKLEYMIQGWPIEIATKQAQLDIAKTKAGNVQREEDDKHQVAQSTVERNQATAAKARSGGSSSSGGVSKSGGGIPWYDKNGNLNYAKTEAEAKQQSKQNGTYVDDYANNSSTKYGITSSTHTHNGWHSRKPAATVKPKTPAKKGKSSGSAKPAKKNTGVNWK